MFNNKKVSVVFPAYNEEENIRNAIGDFFSTKVVDEIIVVDNNSQDNTAKEVRKTKARLVTEANQGYGWALRRGLKEAKGYYIITAEPDGTFVGSDVLKLLIYSEDFDAVFGTRTSKECIWSGANMNLFLRLGNEFVAKFLEYLFDGPSLTDVGCTLKLIKRDALKKIQGKFSVGGPHFSPEFMILCIRNKIKSIEIPVNYRQRVGESKITGDFKRAIKLGIVMIIFILRYRFVER
ncbi:glycosyltransferase family 2 protein [Candidatus Woesearchaeota archaeon]|nr:glycosyltransferase family 2 protein [Candidatus Woesearchaeota archaeon]